jgi:cytoskeleton protein RodZ
VNEEMFPNEEPTVIGPGKLLQIAREEKNLRPEDVAYEIRLTPSQVIALEEDDYSSMPESTYVRGYLRNYARLVGVPENDILMSFARFTRGKDEKPQQVSPTVEKEINRGGSGSKYLALITVLVIIAISAVWVVIPKQEAAEELPDKPTADVSEPVPDEVPVGSTILSLEEPETPETPAKQASDDDNRTQVNGDQEPVEQPADNTPLETVSPPAENLTTPLQETDDNTEEAAGEGMLVIDYSKDSWTDIRDANGKKLIYRTVKAGETVAVSGALPLSLFFGFAQGVDVSFNGRKIDMAAHTRGVFARFTVGNPTSP